MIVASETYFFPDPIYIAMDDMVFIVEYPPHCNVFSFLGAILFNNTNVIKNRVVVNKIITSLKAQ